MLKWPYLLLDKIYISQIKVYYRRKRKSWLNQVKRVEELHKFVKATVIHF